MSSMLRLELTGREGCRMRQSNRTCHAAIIRSMNALTIWLSRRNRVHMTMSHTAGRYSMFLAKVKGKSDSLE